MTNARVLQGQQFAEMTGPGPRHPLMINVLGGLSLFVAGRPLALANRKARALIAYLALEETAWVSRERLAGLLWTESSERHARNSLRQTLMELREALDARGCSVLRTGRDEIALAREEIQVDIDTVLAALATGGGSEPILAQCVGADQLLAGYEDLSPMFRDWVAAARRSSQERLQRALRQSYEDPERPRLTRRGFAQWSLAIDPLNEAACRAVMRLAAEDGEIGIALHAYAALYEVMGVDLDMEPSEATQTLVAEIKQGRIEAPPPRMLEPAGQLFAQSRPFDRLMSGGAPVVAVLPLHAMGPDPSTVWVAEGIVEDIVRVLAGLREPVVISHNSTRNFRGAGVDLQRAGEALGAHYLVSGSVRMAEGNARIAVELAEASNGAVLWSNVYDASAASMFETQERIAAGIANTLVPQVNAAELRRSRGRRPEDLGAYHLLLRARYLVFQLDRQALDEAGTLLRQAAERDPEYPPIHAALADWYSLRVFQGWSTDPAADARALEDAARTAIRLDPCHARALALLGHNRTIVSREYQHALGLFEKALAAAPNDAETWMWSSPTFAYVGQTDDAIARAERALSLSPHDPFLFRYEHFLGIAHYAAGNLEEAVHWGKRSLAGNPNYTSNLRTTVAAMIGLGKLGDAITLARTLRELQPGFSVAAIIANHAFRDEAQRMLYGQRLSQAGLPR